MASIIIDEIVPTKWRLRLRDPEGKTREVEVRAGTPVQLDVDGAVGTGKKDEKEAPKEGREKPRVDEKSRTAEKPRTDAADKNRAADKARDKSRPADKPRADAADKARADDRARTVGKAKAGHATKAIEEKPAPEPPPAIRRRKPDPGPGPGGLNWEPIEDDGIPGLRASFERGAFKILHAGGDAYGLFYEWNSGKYQTLQCGPLDALQQAAARWTEDGKLHAPRSNLGAEAAKLACAPKDGAAATTDTTTKDSPPAKPPVPAKPPAPESPPVDPEKDNILMQGFEASVQKMIAARKGAT